MKILGTFLFTLLFTTQVFATLKLAEPDELLKRAKGGRADLRAIIMDIELNIPEMRDPATFDKYFYLLDQLTEFANVSQLNDYYPNAVKDLASLMADNGMRWLNVTQDSQERMQYYVRWMTPPVIERLLGLVDYQLDSVTDLGRLKTAANNLESILPLVQKIAGDNSYSLIGFRRILSTTAVNVLKSPGLTQADKLEWIRKVKIPSEFAEYVDIMALQIYSLKADNKKEGHDYLDLLVAINLHGQTLQTGAPTSLVTAVQDLIVETLIRMVNLAEVIKKEEFKRAIDSLNPRQIQGLAQAWMSVRYNPSPDYVYTYLQLSGLLVNRAQELDLTKEATQLLKWLSHSSTPVVMRVQDLEGKYAMVDNAGEVWTLTLAIARDNLVIACLSNADRSIQRSLYNISYDFEKMEFIASDREPDTTHERNAPLHIALDKKGFLWIKDEFAIRPESRLFRGRRVQSFEDRYVEISKEKQKPAGVYEGNIIFPSGKSAHVRLSVSILDGYLVGKLEEVGNTLFFADLTLGSLGTDGIVYLTTGRRPGAGWLQLRGVLRGDQLEIQTLVGGVGLSTEKTTLYRIE
ncbi:hypothetical protein [Bdellovibrio sp. HCB2-146]|uniref:hypothetical protein n=1 Tax=Bdellovibrio sp. HCB2-146 TaxID=3394362 RepID=UPI0039BC9D0B